MSFAPLQAPTQYADALPSGLPALLGVLASSAFLMILNETVLAVALPQLMAEFGVDAATVQWLSTGFMLTMAVVIPTTGFLLERFTTARSSSPPSARSWSDPSWRPSRPASPRCSWPASSRPPAPPSSCPC